MISKKKFWQKNRPVAVVLLIAAAGFLPGFNWGLPEAVSSDTVQTWAVDTIAPIAPLNEAYYRFTRSGNEWPTYPLFHYILTDIVYAPYLGYQYVAKNISNPSGDFPYGLKKPQQIARHLTLIARAISLVMGIGIVFLMYKIAASLFTEQVGFWAALSTALIAPLAYYAKTSNLDVPYIFWCCLAFWFYVRIVQHHRLKDYVFLAASVAFAIATKDQAYGFFVLIPVVLIYDLARHLNEGRLTPGKIIQTILSKPILITGLATILVYGIANNLFFGGWHGFLNHLKFISNLYDYNLQLNPQKHSLASEVRLFFKSQQILMENLGPGTYIFSLAGVYMTLRRRNWPAASFLVFFMSYFVFCIMLVARVYERYLLLPSILLTPFAGVFVVHILRAKFPMKSFALLGVFLSFLTQAWFTANLDLTLVCDSRYRAESWIRSNLPKGSVIETQIRQRHLPYINKDYRVSVVGQTLGTQFGGEIIAPELTEAALRQRSPSFILVLRGLGISGDPDTVTNPESKVYFDKLLNGRLGYRIIARFETPSFLPFRQIPGTRPTTILLSKVSPTNRSFTK